MSLRCPVCGSKRITEEIKKEGYDVIKGVVGTALIGIPGALAGAGGKENTYYHCADCGHVLNKVMPSVESDWIDMLLENPENWEKQLKEKKAIYKNIEWEDVDNTVKPEKSLTREEKKEQMEEQILCYLNQVGTMVEESKIKRHLGLDSEEWNLELADVLESLFNSGRIDEDIVDSEYYYGIVRDRNEVETKRLKREAIDTMFQMKADNEEKWSEKVWSDIEKEKNYSWDELLHLAKKSLKNEIISKNPWLTVMVAQQAVSNLCIKELLYKKEERYYVRSFEEAREAIQEKERKKHQKKKAEYSEIKEKILYFLSRNLGLHDDLDLCSKLDIDVSMIKPVLKEMSDEGSIELKIEENSCFRIVYYSAVVGYMEKIKEEERRKAEKIKEEERRKAEENEKKKEEINKEIEQLKKQLAEQEAIVLSNKHKLFGEGAIAKKEAKNEIENLNKKIAQFVQEISDIR